MDAPESSGCDDKVKLEVMGRTKSIPSTMRVKEFPVLVRVTAPLGNTKSSRAGLDLVAVLGTSESMMLENRLDSMKQAMMFVIDNLGPDDRLSVVSFNETTQCLTELSVMTEVPKNYSEGLHSQKSNNVTKKSQSYTMELQNGDRLIRVLGPDRARRCPGLLEAAGRVGGRGRRWCD
ncbi:hypothetical protein EJB05_37376, partial [Eragrostis curvula]